VRRVVAVLGAVLLVLVAVVARGALDGDDDSDGGSSGSDSDGSDGEPGISLVCIEELQAVCEALEEDGAIEGFSAEPAGDTVDRLADQDAELGADAWLTLDPFPGIADVAGDQAGEGRVFGDVEHSGRSTPLGLAVHPDRTAAVDDVCDDVTWTCALDVAGDRWADHGADLPGSIELGLPDPGSTATGLLLATQAVGEVVGTPDFASNDLTGAQVSRALRVLDESGAEDPLTAMITRGAGQFTLVGALGNDADAIGATDQGAGIGIFYPAPMFRAEVVLAAPGGSAEDLLDEGALADALGTSGWSDDAIDTPLPDPGVLYALREELS
jgi:hypothetical protein